MYKGKEVITGQNSNLVTAPTTGIQMFGPNPKRIMLVLSGPIAAASGLIWSITTNESMIGGMALFTGAQPLILRRRDIGDVISDPIFVSAVAGTLTAYATEFFTL